MTEILLAARVRGMQRMHSFSLCVHYIIAKVPQIFGLSPMPRHVNTNPGKSLSVSCTKAKVLEGMRLLPRRKLKTPGSPKIVGYCLGVRAPVLLLKQTLKKKCNNVRSQGVMCLFVR